MRLVSTLDTKMRRTAFKRCFLFLLAPLHHEVGRDNRRWDHRAGPGRAVPVDLRGLQSSSSQLNLSRFWVVVAETTQRILQRVRTSTRQVDECKPLVDPS